MIQVSSEYPRPTAGVINIKTNLLPAAVNKYRAGYTDCAREVARYLATPEPPPMGNMPTLAEPGSKARLLRHLDQCIAEIDVEICPHTTTTTTGQSNFVDSPNSSNTCYDLKKVHSQAGEEHSLDYSSQDSNPLDYSKGLKLGEAALLQASSTSSLATTTTTILPVQDENNNRGQQAQPQTQLHAHTQASGQAATNGTAIELSYDQDANKVVCVNVLEQYKQQLKVVESAGGAAAGAGASNGVLVLPPHYVQLAAALGLNAQPMVDPIATRTDFERLIELQRMQPHLAGKLSPNFAGSLEAAHVAAAAAAAYANSVANSNTAVAAAATAAMLSERPASVASSSAAASVSSGVSDLKSAPATQQSSPRSESGIGSNENETLDASPQTSSAARQALRLRQEEEFRAQQVAGQQGSDESMWRPW